MFKIAVENSQQRSLDSLVSSQAGNFFYLVQDFFLRFNISIKPLNVVFAGTPGWLSR